MKFELGKTYIVEVTENGIIPTEEFNEEHYYDIEHDDLDFLTDEEKAVVVTQALEDVRAEIEKSIEESAKEAPISECGERYGFWKSIEMIDRKIKEIKHESI